MYSKIDFNNIFYIKIYNIIRMYSKIDLITYFTLKYKINFTKDYCHSMNSYQCLDYKYEVKSH